MFRNLPLCSKWIIPLKPERSPCLPAVARVLLGTLLAPTQHSQETPLVSVPVVGSSGGPGAVQIHAPESLELDGAASIPT